MKKQCPKCKATFTSSRLEFCVCGGKLFSVRESVFGDIPAGNRNIDAIMDKFHEIMDNK